MTRTKAPTSKKTKREASGPVITAVRSDLIRNTELKDKIIRLHIDEPKATSTKIHNILRDKHHALIPTRDIRRIVKKYKKSKDSASTEH